MNFETSRLRTFKNWPANAVVDARRIAKAGFYYTGRGLEVQCFSCGGRISEWNYGDKVMSRHRWLDFRCPFVVNPAKSGNVPIECLDGSSGNSSISNRASTSLQVEDQIDSAQTSPTSPQSGSRTPPVSPPPVLRSNSIQAVPRSLKTVYQQSELARLHSFDNWPKPYIVTPESLARAGFYYTRDNDTVKCAFCSIMVGHWEQGDDPITEHIKHYPNCSFLIRIGLTNSEQMGLNDDDDNDVDAQSRVDFPTDGVNIRAPSGSTNGETVNARELGVQCHQVPKHPKYGMLESRLQTYNNWPGDVSQTPEDLAEAGFYYAGSGDQVKCFHCDGGLRMWDPNDDPWVEHARYYQHCGYITLVKGQPFIDSVLRDFPPLGAEEIAQLERVNTKQNDNVQSGRPLVSITDAELQELMSSPQAVAALQVGIEVSRVKTALRQRAETGGLPFHSIEALINAALDVQLEETPEPDMSEAWSTPPSSPVRLWPRRVNHTQSDNTSEGATTEPEDMADYPSPRFEPRIIEPPSDEETDDGIEQHNNSRTGNFNYDGDDSSTVAAEDDNSNSVPVVHRHSQDEAAQRATLEDESKQLKEENRRLKEARLCKICMDNEISVVFLPCSHLVTCVLCATSLADCPVCRKEIKATVRTFLS